MFLATTALSEFWDRDQEILFLGSWCCRHDRRSQWQSLNYQILHCPWDDRQRLRKAAEYVDQVGERMLDNLTEYLNSIHGLSHRERYWRILVGPWLLHYIQCSYDRYVLLCEALKKYPDLQTIVLDPRSFRTPKDTLELLEFLVDDPYNLQIFSQQLHEMGYRFPTRTLESGWDNSESELVRYNEPRQGALRNAARRGLRKAEWALCRAVERRCAVALCRMGWSSSQRWSVALRACLWAAPYKVRKEWSFQIGNPASDDRRNKLKEFPGSDEFERLFIQSLPQSFPPLYIERFHSARSEALGSVRKIPPVIASAVGWYFDEPFKFVAAEASERGSHLVAVQVGGGYGTYAVTTPEQHERRLADRYMVWGWAEDKKDACRNLPSPFLSSFLTKGHANPSSSRSEAILFVATAHPRYLYRFHSPPVAGQWEEYFDWEIRYLAALPDRLRRFVLFRRYVADFGHAIQLRISEQFPDLQWDRGGSIRKRIRGSRIVVIDHQGTTLLETLAANIPTVLFWDPCRWEVREEASPYFDQLRAAGVLWESPEEAAGKVSQIYDDPWIWWGSEVVQRIRRRFAERYALARKDWRAQWVQALREEVALSPLTGNTSMSRLVVR